MVETGHRQTERCGIISGMVDSPEPWVRIPDDLADELKAWSELLVDLWRASGSVGVQLKAVAAGSQADLENRYLDAAQSWNEHEATSAGLSASRLVQGASQYLLGLRAVIPDELVLSPWPVARAVLEHASRAVWILDPEVVPERRVARHWTEWLHGACQRRWALSYAKGPRVAAAKKHRDAVLAELLRRFPDSQISIGRPEDVVDWRVFGEGYPSITKAADRMAVVGLGRGSALYAVMAASTHPSLTELHGNTLPTSAHGYTTLDWKVDSKSVLKPFKVASLAVYRATWAVGSFFALDGSRLEEWADVAAAVSPDLFNDTPGTP